VTVSVTVASAGGTPAGTVDVDDGAGETCTITLSGGSGSCTINPTSAGPRTITAGYNGTANFAGSSDTAPHTVSVAATTTTITADTPDPSVVGQTITVNFTVTSGFGTPSGNVNVSDGTDGCSASVAAGTCSFTPSTAGPNTITANYVGDANHAASSDNASHQVDAFGPADGAQSTATVPDGHILQQTTITVQARDQFGNAVGIGGATVVVTVTGSNNTTASVTDNGDGTYTASYTCGLLPGTDTITITLDGTEISGSPFTSNVGL